MNPQESPFRSHETPRPIPNTRGFEDTLYPTAEEQKAIEGRREELRIAREKARIKDKSIEEMIRDSIDVMIEKEGVDFGPRTPLSPNEFETREPVKARSGEISKELEALSDPVRARAIYEETKRREAEQESGRKAS